MKKTAHGIIDEFSSKGNADLRADFSFCYPLAVFVQILGLPANESNRFHEWAIDLTLVASDPEKGIAASQKMLDYLTPVVQRKRADPTSDLISILAAAEVDGTRLSDVAVVSFLRLLILAGAETTSHLLSSALYCLLKDPDLLERVLFDRSLVPALLGETLRWEAPIATVIRQASRETEISGVTIAKGTNVLCNIGSANRDERFFHHPEVFDIDRVDKEHIAFGFGKHFCAGSRLALLEAEVGINAILDRLPNLQVPAGEEFRITGFSFRGADRLPVEFDI